ncbi:MAG: hypothetical protein WKF75_09780 [Singulisphaera sp.]
MTPLVEVRGRFTCEESGQSPGETYATMFLAPDNLRVAAGRSLASTFAMRLPAGRYQLRGGESGRHVGARARSRSRRVRRSTSGRST